MASTSSTAETKHGPPRRLSELLQEEQEPFVLEIYLLERGCRRRSLELEGRFGCCSAPNRTNNLSKVLKRSSSYHGSTSTSSGQFSNIAKKFYSKIVSLNQVIGLKSLKQGRRRRRNDDGDDDDDKEVGTVESERFSSASSSTLCNSFSGSDVERESVVSTAMNANLHEPAPDRVMTQWRFIEDNKQCSPVSVLDEIDFLQDIPVYNNVRQAETPSTSRTRFQKKVSEDSILSATLLDLLVQLRKPKPERETSLPLHMNSKKALQQTRQLLFDCVKEVVEMSHKGRHQINRMKRKQKGLIIGPEEIGKIICNNLKAWGKLSTDETNIAQLLRVDLLASTEEWANLEVYKRDVAWDIGDDLLEEMTDDIVKDMIDQY